MRHVAIGSTDVYIAPIAPGTGDDLLPGATAAALAAVEGVKSARRRCELLATWALAASVFGPDVVIGHDPFGVPFIEGRMTHISISHCADCVVIAVNDKTVVGVDAEVWRPQLLRVRERFLTPAEVVLPMSRAALLQAWTIKEAVYKAAMMPGLSFQDIHLPAAGSRWAVAEGVPRLMFRVESVELTCDRAVTLVTP